MEEKKDGWSDLKRGEGGPNKLPYEASGLVIRGFQRGTELGIKTGKIYFFFFLKK